MRNFTLLLFIVLSLSANAQWTKVSTQNVGLTGRMHTYNSTLFLYGVFSGFHLYKSTDEGANWTDIANKFPYDVFGKEIATLLDEEKSEGVYNVSCNLNHLTSGIYLYKLEVGQFSETKRMLLVK
jgi:hypothetical protein